MKKKNKRIRRSGDYDQVYQYLVENANKALNYKQIASAIPNIDQKEVSIILNLLVRDGKIEQLDRGKYYYRSKGDELIGTLDFNQRGDAYLVSEQMDQDVKVKQGNTLDAFQGDKVKVKVSYSGRSAKPVAKVVEVLERSQTSFVGTMSVSGNLFFVIPDSNKLHSDFYIPPEKTNNAKNGDKVLIEFRDWPKSAKNPYGKVIKVFGQAGENDAEMHAIVAEFGFDTDFADAVEYQASQLKPDFEAELSKRLDFRPISTFTIDPHDAKDFDDAISFEKLSNGNYQIGVHIADVSHYVKPNDAIDQEAYKRATSVYLVDRTIPMLPERLSNELCSLRPHEDSFCFAVIFTLSPNAKVIKHKFAKTIIHSDHRLAYEDAQECIEGGKHPIANEIRTLNDLAKKLRNKRFENGAINFETTEFKFELDEKGVPISVQPKARFDAHKLIEEFMLLANKHVAKFMYTSRNKAPIPYRVHEEPSVEKLQEFASTAATFGFKIDISDYSRLSKSINEMVQKVEGTLEGDILQPLAIRSMEKAYYTSKKTGHFGLAFDYYAHFTSPIRRYPDLLTHRMLYDALSNKQPYQQAEMENMCQHCSNQEQKAVSAERASVKYKQVEYLSAFKGEEFEGIISGLTEWGMYVEIIENKCEGMVRVKDMKGDKFSFRPEIKKLVGSRTGKTYSMGDRIWIRIKQTNLQRRTIDFEVINE